jgi:hypothetical protein
MVWIRARKGDTIQVSAIGYSFYRFTIDEGIPDTGSIMVLRITPYIYPITSVSVNQLGSYDQFKWQFLHLDPSRLPKEIPEKVLDYVDEGLDTVALTAPPSFGSPVTALYMLFSKEGKSVRRLAALKEKDDFEREITHKFNPELVSRVTGYEGRQVYEFIEFCNFSRKFLREANDYQIIEAILKKQKLYVERDPGL